MQQHLSGAPREPLTYVKESTRKVGRKLPCKLFRLHEPGWFQKLQTFKAAFLRVYFCRIYLNRRLRCLRGKPMTYSACHPDVFDVQSYLAFPASICDLLTQQAQARAGKAAIIRDDRILNLARLELLAAAIAQDLSQCGAVRGDLIGISADRIGPQPPLPRKKR